MSWIYAGVGLAVAGLVPIAVLTARVVVAMRGLIGEIERATTRLEPVQARLRTTIGAFGQQER